MKKVFDAVVSTGKYTDKQGNEKNRYLNVGAVLQNDKGEMSLKLEAIPVVGFNGWINFYEPKVRDTQQSPGNRTATDDFDDDKDIPF